MPVYNLPRICHNTGCQTGEREAVYEPPKYFTPFKKAEFIWAHNLVFGIPKQRLPLSKASVAETCGSEHFPLTLRQVFKPTEVGSVIKLQSHKIPRRKKKKT